MKLHLGALQVPKLRSGCLPRAGLPLLKQELALLDKQREAWEGRNKELLHQQCAGFVLVNAAGPLICLLPMSIVASMPV